MNKLTTHNSQLIDKVKNERSSGFTLIELLIVVVVIATLMGLIFRLAGVGEDQAKRNRTITRMQKLEFALSGYYAAFGSYPPVPLHGTRDIFCSVNDHGIQIPGGGSSSADGGGSQSDLNWIRVRAACLSQPVACEFPYNGESQLTVEGMKLQSKVYGQKSDPIWGKIGNFDILESNESRLSAQSRSELWPADSSPWQEVQVFKFGVMSFLLPRYLFMLAGPKDLYDSDSLNAQWKSQNDLSTLFDFKTGKRIYDKWERIQEDTYQRTTDGSNKSYDNYKYRRITMQPSQAVCARWVQALDGIVSGGREFYGVNTALDHAKDDSYHDHGDCNQESIHMLSAIYAPGKASSGSFNNQYILDGMTVRDGWGMDFFYYSPPPYQSYRLWSAGPDGKTIPPWIDLKDLSTKNRKTAAEWMVDDITGLSASAN